MFIFIIHQHKPVSIVLISSSKLLGISIEHYLLVHKVALTVKYTTFTLHTAQYITK